MLTPKMPVPDWPSYQLDKPSGTWNQEADANCGQGRKSPGTGYGVSGDCGSDGSAFRVGDTGFEPVTSAV